MRLQGSVGSLAQFIANGSQGGGGGGGGGQKGGIISQEHRIMFITMCYIFAV